MGEYGVCAIIVTYHPDADALSSLSTVARQVDAAVVVDNGSSPDLLIELRRTCSEEGFTLIENESNLGIATALNIGIRSATLHGFKVVLLLDQDSRLPLHFVETMIGDFQQKSCHTKLGLLVPLYVDRKSGEPMPLAMTQAGDVAVARTSGTLISTEVIEQVGAFRDDMFIDLVDYEYCLRLRRLGYVIATSPRATLTHSLGRWQKHVFFGRQLFTSTHHNAVRRYYQTRNGIWMAKEYRSFDPRFSLSMYLSPLKEAVKVILAEEQKARKVIWMLRGFRDGIAGRMGAVQTLYGQR